MTSSNKTFSVLLPICVGNSLITGEFPTQRPLTRSFDVFFDMRLNKRLSKQSWGWWFETSSRPIWRHCNVIILNLSKIEWFVTHSNIIITGSDNGLAPGRRQVVIWTNAGILFISVNRNRAKKKNFSEILSTIHTLSFRKMHLEMSSAKLRLGIKVLRQQGFRGSVYHIVEPDSSPSGWSGSNTMDLRGHW